MGDIGLNVGDTIRDVNGVIWRTAELDGKLVWTTVSTEYPTGTTTHMPSGTIIGTSGSTTATFNFSDIYGINPYNEEMKSVKEIDENTQKEIDKIGKPGKRNLDDLLASFKVIKDPKNKLSAIEQLEDESWIADAFDAFVEPETEISSDSIGT